MKPEHSHVRWQVVAALFSLSFLTIVDRVCISAAKNDMSLYLGLSDVAFGWVFGVFALGYAVFQIPSGRLVDRYGPRTLLAAIVLLWSLLTGATGLVFSSVVLITIRFLFGLAEAGAYPAAGRASYNWLPTPERGVAQGLIFAGSRLGAAFGLAVMSLSVERLGWRQSFWLLGVVGIFWAACWFLWFRHYAVVKRGGSVAQLAHIGSGRPAGENIREPVKWRALMLAPGVPPLLVQYFASNFTFFLCFSWLLPYLRSRYGLTAGEAGVYASVPLYFGAFANWISGMAVDALYKRGYPRWSRRGPAIAGFALATVALIAAASMPSVGGAVFFFALATLGVDLTLSPSWTACMDIAGKHTGTLSGAMNMMGNIGSFASSVTFPYLLELTSSPKTYFYIAALLNIAAIGCWLRVRPREVRNSQ